MELAAPLHFGCCPIERNTKIRRSHRAFARVDGDRRRVEEMSVDAISAGRIPDINNN